MFSMAEKKVPTFYSPHQLGESLDQKTSATDESSAAGKSSYYVWFLGSREARGLRGPEYIRPVVRYLLQDRHNHTDVKLTLQVSSKGLKIVQSPDPKSAPSKKMARAPVSHELMKQFVPHSAITCVYQSDPPHDDVVSCILLVSTGTTVSTSSAGGSECPLYVHSYRCDSSETAALLRSQMQALVERPENQEKFDDIEARLIEKGLLLSDKKLPLPSNAKFSRTGSGSNASSKMGSDGRSVGKGSDSSSELNPSHNPEKLVTLYDSLAAELREKLNSRKHPPLLLPPRDYDTMHRSKGNLEAIEARKALNPAIVGKVAKLRKAGGEGEGEGGAGKRSSSDRSSSGIGSDEASPSPPNQMERYSSDDDWPELKEATNGKDTDGLFEEGVDHRGLVSIQPYVDRNLEQAAEKKQRPVKKTSQVEKKVAAFVNKGQKVATVTRKSSFSEIQQKFQSMAATKAAANPIRKVEESAGIRPAPVAVVPPPIRPSEVKGVAVNDVLNREVSPEGDCDTGYISRDKSRTRDSRVFGDSSPVASSPMHDTNARLENYLAKHNNSREIKARGDAKVKRQASKCGGMAQPNDLIRRANNMEAVGEFEKVWSWADENVPLTRELSPEFRQRLDSRGVAKSGHHSKVLSPVEQRRSRARSPTSGGHIHQRQSRGQSSPPELRKVFTRPGEKPTLLASRGLHGHDVKSQPQIRRRALSPDIVRRNSSRGGGRMGREEDNNGPVRILRREKTSVFDNRYPSLDLRSEKRKSLFEKQDERPDLRRRSYHELNNPELLHHPALNPPLPRNFPHSGKKSSSGGGGREPSVSSNGSSHGKKQQQFHPGVVAAMPPPPPHWNPHLHPHPAEMMSHRNGPFYHPHPMVRPHGGGMPHPHHAMSRIPGGMIPGPPGQAGRFGIAPLRQY